HDVVESSEEGLAFIAMEYVRGTNLKQVLQSGQPLSLDFVVEIVAQVGEALDYAHSNRVIHRDVKPANILITEDRRVKITDFGIARIDTSNLTQEGQLLGTPNYMAPEQIQGREVDHRADLFALGVVFYEMLTRHKPFQGENLTVVSHRIVYDHFTPPRDYVRDLPPPVEKVLTRALEKEPARRYQRAREMAEDLRRAVAQTVSAEDLNETQSLASTMVVPSNSSQAGTTPPSWPGAQPALPGAAGTVSTIKQGSAWGRWKQRLGLGTAGAAAIPAAPANTVPPLPPAPDVNGTASGTGTGTGSGFGGMAPAGPAPAGEGTSASSFPSVPALPPPPPLPGAGDSARLSPPPARPAGRVSPLRAGIALLLGALLLFGGNLWLASLQQPTAAELAAVQRQEKEEALRPALLNLIREGNQRLLEGNPEGAVQSFRAAEQLAPQIDGLRRMRLAAQQKATEMAQMTDREREIEGHLVAAREAVKTRRYNEASVAVVAALQLDPQHPEAMEMLKQIGEAQRRLAQTPQPRTPQQAGSQQGTASETPLPDGASEGGGTAGESPIATIKVSVTSEMPSGGRVRVFNNGQPLLDTEIEPARRGKLLNRQVHPVAFTHNLEVPEGSAQLVVHVIPKGKGAIGKVYEAFFLGGSQRELVIRASVGNQATIDLRQ
ncbi:MAG TPA: serine/threonine-protein kinase, partial [Thermoanaerobaculia bacterium]|nr:serine/threonine-protein kinase [Thermoanaerobaculia bacterium]